MRNKIDKRIEIVPHFNMWTKFKSIIYLQKHHIVADTL